MTHFYSLPVERQKAGHGFFCCENASHLFVDWFVQLANWVFVDLEMNGHVAGFYSSGTKGAF